jgi:hypothetical protein
MIQTYPGQSAHENLSGEWAAALRYDGIATTGGESMWLTPWFIHPDFSTNSTFYTVEPLSTWDDPENPTEDYDTGYSLVSNGIVEVAITYSMQQTADGKAVGLRPGGSGSADPVRTGPYVLVVRYDITNVSGAPLSNLSFFQFLHAHPNDDYGPNNYGVYDPTPYAEGAFQPYRYDITQYGASLWNPPGSDITGFSSADAPAAWGIGDFPGHYGEPATGLHRSVYSDSLPGTTSGGPAEIAGAMKWSYGTLGAGATVTQTVLLWNGWVVPQIPPVLPTTLLRGNLHSHSRVSDAKRLGIWDPTPANIFNDYAGAAFLGVGDGPQVWALTDHYPAIDTNPAIDTMEWEAVRTAAVNTTAALGMYGFEWSDWRYSGPHINVIGSSDYPCATGERIQHVADLFSWLAGSNAVGQFNHPSNPVYGWTVEPPGSYGVDEQALTDKMALFEVGSGFYQFDKYGFDRTPLRWLEAHLGGEAYTNSLGKYTEALLAGWRVGATNNQDSHMYLLDRRTGEWKGPSNNTGIWVRDSSREGVLEALRNRWVFASEDWGFRLALTAADVGSVHFMGSRGVGPGPDGKLHLHLAASDDDESIGSVWVLSGPAGGGIPSANWWDWTVHFEQVSDLSVDEDLPPLDYYPGSWYLVVIRQIREVLPGVWWGDGDFVVSSPIWTE